MFEDVILSESVESHGMFRFAKSDLASLNMTICGYEKSITLYSSINRYRGRKS